MAAEIAQWIRGIQKASVVTDEKRYTRQSLIESFVNSRHGYNRCLYNLAINKQSFRVSRDWRYCCKNLKFMSN